jgi:cytochrome P450
VADGLKVCYDISEAFIIFSNFFPFTREDRSLNMATGTSHPPSIPGPRALPLLGWQTTLLRMYLNPFVTLPRLHDAYGDIVALAQGDPSHVLVFGPALNASVLAHPDLFEVSTEPPVKWLKETALSRLMWKNVGVMNGEHHKDQRRLMLPAFHKQQLMRYCDGMARLTQAAIGRWQEQSEIDVLFEMRQLTQRIGVQTLLGLHDEGELEHVGGLMRALVSTLPWLAVPINVPGMPYHRLLHLAEQLEACLRSFIEQKRAQGDSTDVLSALIQAHDEDGARLIDDELVGNAFGLFAAGYKTTAHALTWTLFLLDQHPQVCADLLDELEGTLHGSAPTVSHLQQFPVLDSVLKESLRLLPPAIIGLRTTSAPCEVGGFALPKGAQVIYSEFVTQRLPELYPEPNRFKPERWATLDRSAYEYLPFSAGPHRCIGAGFAMQQMQVVLATLLQRYRLKVREGAHITPNFTMSPVYGMPMRVFPQDRKFQRVPVRGRIHQLIDLNP